MDKVFVVKVSASKLAKHVLPLNEKNSTVAFRGGYKVSRELTKRVINESNPGVRFIMNLGKNNGEILNSIVTAVGTAFVAPIFIAFNPFSKEDKETKVYSAFRQPISAVLALAAQIGINIKFNNWLDTLASTGKLQRADLTAKPKASHLKRIFKLQKPDLSPKDMMAEIQYAQDEAFWQKVNLARNKMKNVPIPTERLIDKNALDDAKAIIKQQFAEQIAKMDKKDATKFISEKAKGIVAENLEQVMKREAANKFAIIQMAQSGKPISHYIDELQKSIANLRSTKGSAVLIQNKEYMLEKLKNLGDFKYVKKLGSNLDEVLQAVRIKRMVKAGINNAELVLDRSKKWGGIFISLVTLPFSCGLLNWSYPRIMEKIMPEASKAKKAKENAEVKN